MFVWGSEILMLAVQLALAWLPSSSAHDAVVLFPLCGAAVNCGDRIRLTVSGVVDPVKLSVVASSRIRPFAPVLPPHPIADPGCADRVPLPAIVGAIKRIAPPDPLPPPPVVQFAA